MNKIAKNRRGMIWKYMTEAEKNCIINATNNGKHLTYFHHILKEFVITDKTYDKLPCNAYWIQEWDKLTGKALEGKWCKIWDSYKEKFIISKIKKYNKKSAEDCYPYYALNMEYYSNAEAITDPDLLEKLENL